MMTQAEHDEWIAQAMPINQRNKYPCGCEYMRVVQGDGYAYVHFAKPDCRHSKKIGAVRCGHLYVAHGTTNDELQTLRERHNHL